MERLARRVEAAGRLAEREIADASSRIRMADLVAGTSLDGGPERADGRNVLLATTDQSTAALALVALDGVASRIVLCPPDLSPDHLPVVMDRAEIDVVATDRDPGLFPGREVVRTLSLPVTADGSTLPGRRTEWLLLTSGTTGVPKLVSHDLAGLTAAIKPRAASQRPAVWSTFYDIRRYGGLQIFFRGLLGSGSLVLSSPGEPIGDHLARLGREGVTHLSGTPSHWRRALMSTAITAIRPDYVRLSGEIADQGLLDRLRQTFPRAQVGHAYASTEAGVGFEVDDGLEGFPAHFVGRDDGAVEMKVVDGSLRIRSPRTASHYVGSGDVALVDQDGFVDTGDMVEEQGGRFRFVGRRGGIINVGGLKVHPEEIEAVINRDARVRMSLVQGRRNPITGAIVVADIVLSDPAAGEDELRREILSACRDSLPAYKVPALLRFVPALEVTPAGKLVRPDA